MARIAVSCNRAFLPGLQTLLYSLRKHNGDVPPVVVFSDELEPGEVPAGVEVRRIVPSHYRDCADAPRWRTSWFKLEVFRMQEPGPIVMLGGDMLCVGDCSELWKQTEYAIRTTRAQMSGLGVGVCSDCLVVGESIRSQETWDKLIDYGRQRNTGGWADQGAITMLTRDLGIDVDWLPDKYSMMKRAYRNRDVDPRDDLRMIHYVGSRKPWPAGIPPTQLERTGGEDGYELVEAVWRRYYEESKALA